MILPDKQIDKFKLYGYHITTTSRLKLIKNEGLLPICGERSKSISDSREAIYFFPALILINNWIKLLYEEKDRKSLELLRLSLKGLNITITDNLNSNNIFGDWYTVNSIPSEKIELLKRIDSNGEQFFLENLLKNNNDDLIWEPINLYNENEMQYLKNKVNNGKY